MKTFVSFYDIIEGVKEETGITNLVNRYNEISRLIVRAERDINPYAGHFIIKNVKYVLNQNNFNGTSIKIPQDFIELRSAKANGLELETRDGLSHILLCNGQVNQIVILSYWATQMDITGFPFVLYNHFEAVIAFIVWKLYSQKAYQDSANMNAKIVYQENYERFAKAARGFDFFPTQKNLDNMRADQMLPKYIEINCEDDCFCACSVIENSDIPIESSDIEMWFWQENSLVQELFEDDITEEYLAEQEKIPYKSFKSGIYFTASNVGRYGIAIKNGPTTPDSIVDVVGASIKESVTFSYYDEKKLLVLISNNYITSGTFYLKIT